MAKTEAKNFPKPDSPLFRADYARADRAGSKDGTGRGTAGKAAARQLTVVSWNIQFAREISTAIKVLGSEAELADADVLLLQEMDERGVEAIARVLSYNYVYYPASIHRRTGREFGNAVLARWPITDCGKVHLPHVSPRTGEIRVAARAEIDLAGTSVTAYSVHTETIALDAVRRREQFQTLAADIGQAGGRHILLGGDFNTMTGKDVRALEEILGAAGLVRASAAAGCSLKVGFLGFCLDHVFARGVNVRSAGTNPRASASDHLPVWLKMTLDPPPA